MRLIPILLLMAASPAYAAEGPFFSLKNSEFVVLLAFICFVGILVYYGVPGKLTGMLDARAAQIKADLNEARALREEAKTILASYERKQAEMREQADRIVATARDEAMAASRQAKADLAQSITRRIAAAEEQIAASEKAVMKDVRDKAVTLAVSVASEVLGKQMSKDAASASVDEAIGQVEKRFH
ncbi:MAG: F0F1 ATP synthase subunit B [Pseudomonadota bacterium]